MTQSKSSDDQAVVTAKDSTRELSKVQQEAVEHVDGPLLILAGPGSGKTRVVTHRIAHLIQQGVEPFQIVALTFTNKAADEMKARIERLVPGPPIWAGTFHSFCARLLRQNSSLIGLSTNFSIYDTDDQKKAIAQAILAADVDLFRHTPDQIANAISRAKNSLITPDNYQPASGDSIGYLMAQIYPMYQQVLIDSNAVDFDDLLMHAALLLRENPDLRYLLDERFKYILVDEYQDTNFAQYALVRALSIDHPNLAVTGDPDQSIYGWRGANLDNILGFERDFPAVKVVRLEQNYRSTKCILRAADALIANNMRRKHKALFTENDEGKPVTLANYGSEQAEADDIAEQIGIAMTQQKRSPGEFAILYRVNAMSRQLERSLRVRGIPYQIVKGTEFFHRKEVKDVLAYLMLLDNPKHNVAFERIVNVPSRKIGKVTLDKIRTYGLANRITFLEASRECEKIGTLQKRTVGIVKRFVEMMDRLRSETHQPLPHLVEHVLLETGYREWLMMEDSEEADERLANIDELVNAAAEFSRNHEDDPTLEAFLQEVALVSDTDAFDAKKERVTLMTLHAAKGLEFPTVFITGVEQGALPHRRSIDSPEQMEEERRLLFVGITRAERELQLSLSKYRMRSGRPWPTVPSCFLMELPREEMNTIGLPTGTPRSVDASWGHEEEAFADIDSFAQTANADHSDGEPSWQIDDAPSYSQASSLGKAKKRSVPASDKAEQEPVIDDMMPTDAAEEPAAIPARVPATAFREGMLVNHPEYGTGTIIGISGTGNKRTASVEFYSDGAKTFRLAYSPLVPAQPE